MSRGHPRTTAQQKVDWLLAREKEWQGFPDLGVWPRTELEPKILALTRRFHADCLSPTTYHLDARASLLKHIVLARRQRRARQ